LAAGAALAPEGLAVVAAAAPRLRITEIFLSIQGETSRVGLPTVFIRLTGCPLRCVWCDSAYAFSGGEFLALPEVLQRVATHATPEVTVTGGEPLAQPECHALLTALCDAGYRVSLETSGAIDARGVDARVIRVFDLKAPGSGEVESNCWVNLEDLRPSDAVKFVLADRTDYDWARQVIATQALAGRAELLLSPVHGRLHPRDLAEWLLADRLPVRLQVQLHKYLWGDVPGR
jgi:7-carboxy-7-deazaguanine synthase